MLATNYNQHSEQYSTSTHDSGIKSCRNTLEPIVVSDKNKPNSNKESAKIRIENPSN